MATKKVYIGGMGPWNYDDAQEYPGEAIVQQALRTDGQLQVEEAPTASTDVLRLADINTLVQNMKVLAVTDIDDPSTELNAVDGEFDGQLMLCYEVNASYNQMSLYAWDSASSGAEIVPEVVDSLTPTGKWIGIAGKHSRYRTYAVVDVADVDDPSAELNPLKGFYKGHVVIARKATDTNVDEFTLYIWDDSVTDAEVVPYLVDGTGGKWVAQGGKYHYALNVRGAANFNDKNDASGDLTVENEDGTILLKCDVSTSGGKTIEYNGVVLPGIRKVSVANIDDPSTELNAIAGVATGDFALIYQTDAATDAYTLYAWDSVTSQAEYVPYSVDGSSGIWAAVAGKYANQPAVRVLPVASIDDPSAELNIEKGTREGEPLICFQAQGDVNAWTMYVWDSASTETEDPPYLVDGSSGFWVATVGKYAHHGINSPPTRKIREGEGASSQVMSEEYRSSGSVVTKRVHYSTSFRKTSHSGAFTILSHTMALANSFGFCRARIYGVADGGTEYANYYLTFGWHDVAGTATIHGETLTVLQESDAAWTAAALGGASAVAIQTTGNGENIRWIISAEFMETKQGA